MKQELAQVLGTGPSLRVAPRLCVCVCVWNCTSVVASLAAHLAYCSVARQKLSRQQCRTRVALLVAATKATSLLT